MRSIWKGAISFGLVTIPVKLYAATDQHQISLHQVHQADGGRIRYQRVCSVCGEQVDYSQVARGYELPDGEMVVLTEEDFADVPLTTSRTVEVLQFTPLEQVDPIYFSKTYYLEPDKAGVKPYVLLRDSLGNSGKVAIVKIALRQRESLATLRVRDGVFVLETMLWPEEIRAADFDFLDEDVSVRSQELKMATSLIDSMTEDFEPGQHHDEYREALQAVIDAKIEGHEVTRPEEPAGEGAAAVDLMSALKQSVDAARRERGSSGGSAESSSGRSAGGSAGSAASSSATSRPSRGGSAASSKSVGRSKAQRSSSTGQGSSKSSTRGRKTSKGRETRKSA